MRHMISNIGERCEALPLTVHPTHPYRRCCYPNFLTNIIFSRSIYTHKLPSVSLYIVKENTVENNKIKNSHDI